MRLASDITLSKLATASAILLLVGCAIPNRSSATPSTALPSTEALQATPSLAQQSGTAQPHSVQNLEASTLASRPSASPELALADHLRAIGARMYGTFWCGYCRQQRELFGSAFSHVEEIECDPRGRNARLDLCRKANVVAFPTWEINGRTYRGVRSLDNLADLSDYSGPRNF